MKTKLFAVCVEAYGHPRQHWIDSVWNDEVKGKDRLKELAQKYAAKGPPEDGYELQLELWPLNEVLGKFNTMVVASENM